jgi:hypothetical protein
MSNKAREALEFIKHASDDYEEYAHTIAGALDVIYEKACAALAEPPRNCDIGTAEEQYDRFIYNCTSRKIPCRLSETLSCTKCYALWMQMPYEEEK